MTKTQIKAIDLNANRQLSAVIQRLNIAGYNIVTDNEPHLNGKGTHARYELKEVQP